jgi:hypothetical protein
MKTKVDITELRKQLKSIGFNVKTHTNSLATFASITHGSETMPDCFFGEDSRNRWLPAILLVQQNYKDCDFVSRGQRVILMGRSFF